MTMASAQRGVSVIVPTYNRRDFLPAAVASLVNQTVPPYEIIVVNDGSDYDVGSLLKGYGHFITVLDKDNEGKPAAVNLGVEKARGDYIWVFDDDDVAEPNYIERCLPYLTDSEADYVFGWHFAGNSLSLEDVEKSEERRPRLDSDEEIFPALLSGCSIAHNAIIARRTCYLELGGMDVTYPCSEDYEFQLRLARRYCGRYLDVPSFTRRVHEGERGGSQFRYQASERRQRFLEQDRRFIGKYLQELPLSEYWLKALARIEDSGLRIRAQYLYKFQVAAVVGLWNVAMATLEDAATDTACASGALEPHEVKRVSVIFAYAEAEVLARLQPDVHMAGISRLARSKSSLFLWHFQRVLLQALAKRVVLYARRTRYRSSVSSVGLLFRALQVTSFRGMRD